MEKTISVKVRNQTDEVASKAKNEARNTAKNPHMAMFVLFAILFNILAFVVPSNANDLWGVRMNAYKVGCGIGCAVLAWCLLHLRDIIREPSLIGAYQMSYDKNRVFEKRGIIASAVTALNSVVYAALTVAIASLPTLGALAVSSIYCQSFAGFEAVDVGVMISCIILYLGAMLLNRFGRTIDAFVEKKKTPKMPSDGVDSKE